MKPGFFRRGCGRHLLGATLLLCLLACAGCRSVGFYRQAVSGQAALWWHRRPIPEVLADPATPPALSRKLRLAQQARQFASDHLQLPRNRSYTYYVQLPRPYVVWNVFATPAYSVEPIQHCFPIAGCVAYRGYFQHAMAAAEAARLRAAGDDVYVGGVSAYSTLGWFADPVLSSMLSWSDDELAGTIFHELAHQQLYVAGDTAFNESFASFVQQQGLREWHRQQGLPTADSADDQLDDDFTRQVLQLRQQLRTLYATDASVAQKAAAKQAAFAEFGQRYQLWRDAHGPAAKAYDGWIKGPPNNAKLVPFGLYDTWIPSFAALFASVGSRWPEFFSAVRHWSTLPSTQRQQMLQQWSGSPPAAAVPKSIAPAPAAH